MKPTPAADLLKRGRELQQEMLEKASKVREGTKRVAQLGLPMAMGGKSDQMLVPGFDVGNVLDPPRWDLPLPALLRSGGKP